MACAGCLWGREILRDLHSVPRIGVPGTMVVYGKHAHPTMVVGSGAILAVAQIGRGWIVVLSHMGYVQGFHDGSHENDSIKTLHSNIKKFLTNGSDNPNVQTMAEVKKLNMIKDGTKILVQKNEQLSSDQLEEAVREFVVGGGALVYGLIPWRWLQNHKGKTLAADVPLAGLLQQAGICFTEKLAAKSNPYPVSDNNETDAHHSHLGHVVGTCIADASNLTSLGHKLANDIGLLPMYILNELTDQFDAFHDTFFPRLVDIIPAPKRTIKKPEDINLVCIYNAMAKRGLVKATLPGLAFFPGSFECSPPLTCGDTSINSTHQELLSTGFYLPAGQEMIITTLEPNENTGKQKQWAVVIGAHSDRLCNKNVLKRWPDLRVNRALNAGQVSVTNPMGGLVYLRSPPGPSSIQVRLENVVEAPFFDLTDPKSVANWPLSKQAPGLWADIQGKHIRFTLPSRHVRELDDPSEVLCLWDRLIEGYHDLRGTVVGRREWFVPDVQPSVGYMHSGYPVVTHMDVAAPKSPKFYLRKRGLDTEGKWGAFHELGHNMQRQMWTFRGFTEITCNIFTLYGMEHISGRKVWLFPKLANFMKKAKEHLNVSVNTPGSETWRHVGLGLVTYAQIVHHFGWDALRRVFREYEALPAAQRPKADDAKISKWIVTLSKTVDADLRPFYDFWGWPISESTTQALVGSNLPLFLPEDEFTTLAPGRFGEMKQMYKMPGTS